MTTATKRCTQCGEIKPVTEFHLRRASDPSGPRRAACRACCSADAQRRRIEGPSIISELARVGMSNPDLLSEKARAAVFTDEPFDPEPVAAWRARIAKEARRKRQVELRRMRDLRPMRFARLETYP